MEIVYAETPEGQRRRTGRSPAYPFLTVQRALEQAKALYDQEGDYAAPLASTLKAWGYGPKSSGGRQTLATMKYYGLIDITGEGDGRKVKVSELARRIILDPREDETEKRQLVRRVAMTPAAHKALYDEYPTGLPSDGSVRHFLMFDQGFKKDAADELLNEFKETASYIGLYEPQKNVDKKTAQTDDDGDAKEPVVIKPGDRIQWTSQGVDQFPDGAAVLGLSEDGQWIFTDQTKTGVPLKDVTIMEAAVAATPAVSPPQMPPHLLAALGGKDDEVKVPAGTRRAVFPLKEGDVSLVFPEGLSEKGLKQLGAYIKIFLEQEMEDVQAS